MRQLRIELAGGFQIDTDAPNAAPVHFIESSVGRFIIDRGNASRGRTQLLNRIERTGVIRAVDGRLNDDHAIGVQRLVQGAHFRDRRRLRRVHASGHIREAVWVTEDVRMAIACALGNVKVYRCGRL